MPRQGMKPAMIWNTGGSRTAASLVLIFATGLVYAQTTAAGAAADEASDGNQIQEVVVTATKHEEPLSKVPVSIAAMD